MNTFKAEKRDLAEKAKKLRREGYVTGNNAKKGADDENHQRIGLLAGQVAAGGKSDECSDQYQQHGKGIAGKDPAKTGVGYPHQ